MLKTCPLPMLKAIIPLGPLNLGWSARSLDQLVIDNRRQFFTNEWMCMKIECPFHVLHLIRGFFQNEDMKRYTRNSVFGNHFIWHMHRCIILIYPYGHMEWVSHQAIFYKFWLVLLAVSLYRIRTDNFFKLLSFTHPHPPKNPPGHKTTSIYCISGQKLQLDVTFNSWFSNIHWYYRIHVVTFPYLSELPPNMNEWMQK